MPVDQPRAVEPAQAVSGIPAEFAFDLFDGPRPRRVLVQQQREDAAIAGVLPLDGGRDIRCPASEGSAFRCHAPGRTSGAGHFDKEPPTLSSPADAVNHFR